MTSFATFDLPLTPEEAHALIYALRYCRKNDVTYFDSANVETDPPWYDLKMKIEDAKEFHAQLLVLEPLLRVVADRFMMQMADAATIIQFQYEVDQMLRDNAASFPLPLTVKVRVDRMSGALNFDIARVKPDLHDTNVIKALAHEAKITKDALDPLHPCNARQQLND